MAKFKLGPIDDEEVVAADEAKKTGKPVKVKGRGTADLPRVDPEPRMMHVDEAPWILQIGEILNRVKSVEMIVTALRGSQMSAPAAKPVAPANGNGHAVPWKEVPGAEALIESAKSYLERHGKAKFKALLAEFGAEKLPQVEGDENKAKLMEKLNA